MFINIDHGLYHIYHIYNYIFNVYIKLLFIYIVAWSEIYILPHFQPLNTLNAQKKFWNPFYLL